MDVAIDQDDGIRNLLKFTRDGAQVGVELEPGNRLGLNG